MYELKRKVGILLGGNAEKIKKFKIVKKALSYINLKHSEKRNIVVQNYGLEAMKIICEECRKRNISIWLDFGTLLGYYREKKFISFDIDLDFGIYAEDQEKFAEVRESLLKKGFLYTRRFEYDHQLVEESFSYNDLNIDVVYYIKKEAVKNIMSYLIVYAMDMNKKPIDIQGYEEENNITVLEATQFMGVDVMVPQNTEEYLKNYYGEDFMTPIPNFDWKNSGLYKELEDSSKCRAIVYENENSK